MFWFACCGLYWLSTCYVLGLVVFERALWCLDGWLRFEDGQCVNLVGWLCDLGWWFVLILFGVVLGALGCLLWVGVIAL